MFLPRRYLTATALPCEAGSLVTMLSRGSLGKGGSPAQNAPPGFALVVALALMTFLFLMVLSLATSVGINTQAARGEKDALIARQNARLALTVALSELQQAAGPDQRVTVRSDALDDASVVQRHLTGVYRADLPWGDGEPSVAVRWLASSASGPADPRLAPSGGRARTLVGSGTVGAGNAEASVVVETIDWRENSLRPVTGGMAWWVGDQGVKASLGLSAGDARDGVAWMAATLDPNARDRLAQMSPARQGIHTLSTTATPLQVLSDVDLDASLGRLAHWRQVGLLPVNGSGSLVSAQNNGLFHDATVRNFGVLTRPGGGLKQDLSQRPDLMGAAFVALTTLDETDGGHVEAPLLVGDGIIPGVDELRRRHRITPPVQDSSPVGDLGFSIAPVLADFHMLGAVFRAEGGSSGSVTRGTATSTSDVMLRFGFMVKLWNPYTSALVPEDLVLEIRGLPAIQVTSENGTDFTFGMQDAMANATDPDGTPYYEVLLPFQPTGFPETDDRSMLPGRVYYWMSANNYSNGSPKVSNADTANFYVAPQFGNYLYEIPVGTYLSPISRPMAVDGGPARLTLRLRRTAANGGQVLAQIGPVDFDSFNYTLGTPTSRGWRFGYRLRLYEPWDELGAATAWDRARWLRNGDVRNPVHGAGNASISAFSYIPPLGFSPSSYTSDAARVSYSSLFDRVIGSTGKGIMEDVPLFELPRQSLLSIGELQHLSFIGERPNSIGNSWGGAGGARFNRVFDDYFFSGITPGLSGWNAAAGDRPPHPRLNWWTAIDGNPVTPAAVAAANGLTAQHLMVQGAFNINAASASAWEAMLSSKQLPGWGFVEKNPNTGDSTGHIAPVALQDSFFRFAQTGEETFQLGNYRAGSASEEPPTEFFRRGVSPLRRPGDAGFSTAEPEMTLLARAVSARIRERITAEGPFTSVEDLLAPNSRWNDPVKGDRNVFEVAIDDVVDGAGNPVIHRAPSQVNGEVEIWPHSPAYLSSADIMTLLAPVASPRSDTFIIRALGEQRDPVTGEVIAVAQCEAVVQRLPEYFRPGSDAPGVFPPSDPLNAGLGRRFQILSMRWLGAEDL